MSVQSLGYQKEGIKGFQKQLATPQRRPDCPSSGYGILYAADININKVIDDISPDEVSVYIDESFKERIACIGDRY